MTGRQKVNYKWYVCKLATLLALAAILSSCAITTGLQQQAKLPESTISEYELPEYTDTLKCRYYDEKSFRRSIANAAGSSHKGTALLYDVDENYNRPDENFDGPEEQKSAMDNNTESTLYKSTNKIKGGVVPHHLLADELIASFFNILSEEKPELVVILAPNHRNIGAYKVSTCYSSWETPFGLLQTDAGLAKTLVAEKTTGINRDIFEEDHSISALIPYIKYYMPQCKILPLLLHGDYSLDMSIQLGKRIAELIDGKEYVILASVDFSHYLTGEEADRMDEITLEAIKKRDLKKIRQMNNDNLDSPPSIITLLSAMDAVKAENITVIDHSNSDKIAGTKAKETTSYFTILFY